MVVEVFSRYSKAYVGYVENSGMFYNIHEAFNMEGCFSINVTPLEANICLLEEIEDGE